MTKGDPMNPMKESEFVAVTGDLSTAGKTVWWGLEGTLSRDDLHRFIEEEGLDPDEWLPKEASKERCFGRAVKALYKSKATNIETLNGGGFAVIHKEKSKTKVTHDQEFAVKLEHGDVVSAHDPLTGRPAPYTALLDITEMTNKFATTMIADDISAWLIECAGKLNAVGLRKRGGFYFIPNGSLKTWMGLVNAVVKASFGNHTIYSMSTMHEDDAVAAVLDALTAEAEEFFASCSEKIDTGKIGGKRAINNRMTDSENLLAKIRSYEALLGTKLETLHEQMGDCELELAAALLKAEEKNDKEVKLAL
jgi:hypothetical protein